MSKKGLTRTSHVEPPALVARSLASLEQAMGGREVLVAALSHAPKSKDLEFLLGVVGDPQYASTPLATLCAMGGITAGELIEAYKAGILAKGQALSVKAIGEALPTVVEETMRLAAVHEDDCQQCQGVGQITPEPSEADPNPGPADCPVCGGNGRLRYDGDLEHKKLALQLGKLLDKGAGVAIQVNQQSNTFVGVAGGALEKMQEAADKILYGGDQPIILDGEATEVPPPPAPAPPEAPPVP